MRSRREFLRCVGLAGVASLGGGVAIQASPDGDAKAVRFGLITDLHHRQFGQDESARLGAFIEAVDSSSPDFVIQCGDFTQFKSSEAIVNAWNRISGPKYHVLGNHDMDQCGKDQFLKLWGMDKSYYSFDRGGFHFVVMDRNFLKTGEGAWTPYDKGNWYRKPAAQKSHTDGPQLEWLRADLAVTKLPVVVFMHQPVFLTDTAEDLGNAREILALFDEANFRADREGRAGKVAAVFMGHDHDDRYGVRNGVHYLLMNSASYAYTRHGASFYRDPLFAFVTLDPKGKMTIEGRTSGYDEKTPDEVRAAIPARISPRVVGF